MNFQNMFTLRPAALGCAIAAFALAASAAAQVTVLSGPVGVMSITTPLHKSPAAHPLIAKDVFVGIASGNSGWKIIFPAGEGDVGATLAAGARYYVEIVTGPLEGERLDVDTAATIAAAGPKIVVDLGATSLSTLPVLGADTLADARCVIRPHLTLSGLQALFDPGLVGTDQGHGGDAVWLQGPSRLERFQLAADGESWIESSGGGGGKWAGIHRKFLEDAGTLANGAIDYRGLVIPPDVSFLIELKSGAKTWQLEGVVRTSAFRKNLMKGYQGFSTGFPVGMSPVEVGAFVDPGTPVAWQWTGSSQFKKADQMQTMAQGTQEFRLFYLHGDGTSWFDLEEDPKVDHSGDPILGPTGAVVLWRSKPDPQYLIPRPFEL